MPGSNGLFCVVPGFWLVASSCTGVVLLMVQDWVLLVQLVGTRGRDQGALGFIAYFFSYFPLFSRDRDIFSSFLFPHFLLSG